MFVISSNCRNIEEFNKKRYKLSPDVFLKSTLKNCSIQKKHVENA